MINQPYLNWGSRNVLVKWMFVTHEQLFSLPETLFLAINMVDRFLGMESVAAKKMRLLGAASLFIAAKMEERCIPAMENLVEIGGGAFSGSDLIQAEKKILNVIEWNLSYSCPLSFIPRVEIAKICPCGECQNDADDADTLAKFFCEVGVIDHRLMHIKSSTLAAAAVRLSRMALDISVGHTVTVT